MAFAAVKCSACAGQISTCGSGRSPPTRPGSSSSTGSASKNRSCQRGIASIRIDGSRRIPVTALEGYASRLLAERTAARLTKLYRELATNGGPDGAGLSPRTVKYVHAVLRKAFRAALVVDQILLSNPVERAKRPRKARSEPGGVWTPAQLRAFLSRPGRAARPSPSPMKIPVAPTGGGPWSNSIGFPVKLSSTRRNLRFVPVVESIDDMTQTLECNRDGTAKDSWPRSPWAPARSPSRPAPSARSTSPVIGRAWHTPRIGHGSDTGLGS